MKRTSSLGASSASFDPSDPFPRLSASELGGKKKSTIMWQRAMRKSAREVPASLPGEGAGVGLEGAGVGLEGAGVGLSSGGGWLEEAAASTRDTAAPRQRPGWGKVRENFLPAPLQPTFKISELMLALRRQQAGAEFARARISSSPTTRRARMDRWGSREEAETKRLELTQWLKSLKSNLPAITRKLVLHGASTQLQAHVRRRLAPGLVAKRKRLLHIPPAPAPAAQWNPYWQIDGDDVGPSVVSIETRKLLARVDKGGRHAHLLPGSNGTPPQAPSPRRGLLGRRRGGSPRGSSPRGTDSFPRGGSSPKYSFPRGGGSSPKRSFPRGGSQRSTSPSGRLSPSGRQSPSGRHSPPVGLAAAAAAAGSSMNLHSFDDKDSHKLSEKAERSWTWFFHLTPSAMIFMVVVLFEVALAVTLALALALTLALTLTLALALTLTLTLTLTVTLSL